MRKAKTNPHVRATARTAKISWWSVIICLLVMEVKAKKMRSEVVVEEELVVIEETNNTTTKVATATGNGNRSHQIASETPVNPAGPISSSMSALMIIGEVVAVV